MFPVPEPAWTAPGHSPMGSCPSPATFQSPGEGLGSARRLCLVGGGVSTLSIFIVAACPPSHPSNKGNGPRHPIRLSRKARPLPGHRSGPTACPGTAPLGMLVLALLDYKLPSSVRGNWRGGNTYLSCFVFEVTHARAVTWLHKVREGAGQAGGTQVFASSSCLCSSVYVCWRVDRTWRAPAAVSDSPDSR